MTLRDPDVEKVMDKQEKGISFRSTWLGVKAAKNPCDAWIYQEIIFDQKPDIIIETGSWYGGGALFMASLMDMIGHGQVYSIDNREFDKPVHNRIMWFKGYSTDEATVKVIKELAKDKRVMVVLDSDHRQANVYDEMKTYGSLVGKGMYMIVEDTWWEPDTEGPWLAVKKFLAEGHPFEIDKSCERYLYTHNPNGYLKRK